MFDAHMKGLSTCTGFIHGKHGIVGWCSAAPETLQEKMTETGQDAVDIEVGTEVAELSALVLVLRSGCGVLLLLLYGNDAAGTA